MLSLAAYSSIASSQFSYSVYNGSFNNLPDFSTLTPIETGTTDVIELSVKNRNYDFALVFTNQLIVTEAASYDFRTSSDDGSRLLIDNTVVVDNDGLHATQSADGKVFLNPGSYALRVEYFEQSGSRELQVLYRVENGIFGAIPADGQLNGTAAAASITGEWSDVITWPHIAISAANLPDGRVLTWSSTETNSFPANREFTHASLFSPADSTFQNADSNFHDMFCAGISTLEDGTIVASGGNPDDSRSSMFDLTSMTWSPLSDMNDRRWYGTNITMPDNQIFSTFAKSAGNRSEMYNPATDIWTRTPNTSMQTLLDEQVAINSTPSPSGASSLEWWAHLAITPTGKVFHGGPTETFHLFDPVNGNSNEVLGQLTDGKARMYGNAVTYEAGQVLLVGGSDRSISPATSSRDVYKVDLLSPTPQVTRVAPMNYPRALSNSVTLPNGEILVIGGNAGGKLFSDESSVLPTEIYNPENDTWRLTDEISIPRNYHSIALLLKDGRVLSAGGGACGDGCNVNHLDGQIFTPPYLFNSDGTSASRPVISNSPAQVTAGEQITITASSDTITFNMVRLSGTTHHLNTDQRFLSINTVNNGNGSYTLEFNANANVLIPGNYWIFALNANGTPSIGRTAQVIRADDPQIDSDGDGVIDSEDAFPTDPTETTDSDDDGVGDNGDAFPNDPTETKDTDGDGIGDNTDPTPTGDLIVTRFLRLTALSEINGNPWASAAEINLLDTDGLSIDRSGWTISASSEESGEFAAPASMVLDGDVNSIWHSAWSDIDGDENDLPHPHLLTIDMGESNVLTALTYTPRADYGNGSIKGYEIHVSNDGLNWGTPILAGDFSGPGPDTVVFQSQPPAIDSDGDGVNDVDDAFPNDPDETTDTDGDGTGDNGDAFPTDPTETSDSDGDGIGDNTDPTPFGDQVSARFVRLTALSEINGNPWATAAELNILGGDGNALNRNAWIATANSEESGEYPAPAQDALDGDIFTIWHSAWSDIDGDENDLPHPHWITIDMGVNQAVTGLVYLPRDDYGNGSIKQYEIHVSANGTTWTQVSAGEFEGPGADIANFAAPAPSAVTPLPTRPANSSTILVENTSGADRIWNVNPDNNSVSVSSAAGELLAEITVGVRPWALAATLQANQIFVANKGSDSVSIIDGNTLAVVQTVVLPSGAQPHGIVFNSDGSEYFIVLEAMAQVERRDSETHTVIATTQLEGSPRHISVKYDNSRLLVSNFITPQAPGESTDAPDLDNAFAEIFVIDPNTMTLATTIQLANDTRAISESAGPGLPNYLNAAVISFDDTLAYVPSKKDNISSGTLRGTPGMTFESTVRANGSRIELDSETESDAIRIDFDNASVATGAALTGDNRYLLTSLETSRELSVYDTLNNFELVRLPTGRAPQGVALASSGDIAYVHNFLDRSVSRFDLTEMIETELPVATELSSIAVVTAESLAANILLGKQLFYDAADDRLARDNYMSCAACHNDGGGDGRVWDFTQFGEGLRNTISLRGRAGMGHGQLHWSGNFDEIQDFEGQIRHFAAGTGLMSDADFNTGTRNLPLGDPKAGISSDLDALADYLTSLSVAAVNPLHSTPPTDSAIKGQALFDHQNCASCHSYPMLTDSATQQRHDIGTITSSSGSRLGQPLDALDAPTLYGLAASAPYLHDGSAATIAAAIQAHAGISLNSAELDDLQRFLLELPQLDALADNSNIRLSTTLPSGAWRQIALPAEVYGLTIEQLFATALPADDYGNSWILFRFDATQNQYFPMALDSTMSLGEGYWILQASGETVTLSLPTGLNETGTINHPDCISAPGCFSIALDKQNVPGTASWNLIGNPFPTSIDAAGLRVTQGGNSYNLDDAQSASLTTDRIFVFSGEEGYRQVTMDDQLNPWAAGWIALFPEAPGDTSLLVPQTAPDL